MCIRQLVKLYSNALRAATAIEYALIGAGIAVAISVIVYALGDQIVPVFTQLVDGFSGE